MSELAIISVDKEFNPIKEKNLILSIVFSNFIWMVFHFTVVFFFTFQLKSVALVGFFLGIGNLFSFFLDISIGIIQKYFKPKTLFLLSFISQIIAMFIFAYFIFQVGDFVTHNAIGEMGVFSIILKFFLGQGANFLLLILASFCYGLTKELQEVTYYSYILNNSSQNQVASLLAKKNLFGGIGAFVGLIISGIILKFPPIFILILTIVIIIFILYFTITFFDNDEKTITLQDIYKFNINLKNDQEKITLTKSVNKFELKNIITQSKYIFLKPMTIKSGLTIKLLYNETKKEFKGTLNILTNKANTLIIYWSLIMVMTFGFWDTFAATFLIGFLDTLWNGGGYLLLGLIAIPAFGLQDLFSKLANKIGVYTVSNIGLVLSGTSLFLMGIFSIGEKNIFLLIGLALVNSIGYAACMSLSQALFLESYNEAFAKYNNLAEIDVNASAAPLKIVGNFANVIGLFLGGIILALLDYMGFFILFGICIIYILYWTIKNKVNKKIK